MASVTPQPRPAAAQRQRRCNRTKRRDGQRRRDREPDGEGAICWWRPNDHSRATTGDAETGDGRPTGMRVPMRRRP